MKTNSYCRYQYNMEVPFFDIDSMFIVWHGHYIKYLELARCAFLNHIQHNYLAMRDDGFMYPIVKLDIKYIKPARFGQNITIDLAVVEFESHLRIQYTIFDTETGVKLSKASTQQVAVCLHTQEMQFQTSPSLQQAIRNYMEQTA